MSDVITPPPGAKCSECLKHNHHAKAIEYVDGEPLCVFHRDNDPCPGCGRDQPPAPKAAPIRTHGADVPASAPKADLCGCGRPKTHQGRCAVRRKTRGEPKPMRQWSQGKRAKQPKEVDRVSFPTAKVLVDTPALEGVSLEACSEVLDNDEAFYQKYPAPRVSSPTTKLIDWLFVKMKPGQVMAIKPPAKIAVHRLRDKLRRAMAHYKGMSGAFEFRGVNSHGILKITRVK